MVTAVTTKEETVSKAIETFINVSEHPFLKVPQHVIYDAVQALAVENQKVSALRLLRGAYFDDEEGWASLMDALAIYSLIISCSNSGDVARLREAFECNTQMETPDVRSAD